MSNLALIVSVGLLGGMCIGLQAPLANLISQKLGVLESVFLVHLGGAIVVAIALACIGGGKIAQWQILPWHAWLAGVMGVIGVAATLIMIPRIGVAGAVTLIIAGQLSTAAAIDHFGLLGVTPKPVEWQRLGGLALVLLGAWLAIRR